jgi:uncharacterized protein YoxC
MAETVATLAVRVDKLERDTSELFGKTNDNAIAQATITEKLSNILVTVGEIKQAVSEIQKVPGKRWNSVIENLIYVAICIIAGAMAGHFIKF